MPEIRLYGKNPKKVMPGLSRSYWTDIKTWKDARKKATGRYPTTINVTTKSANWGRELSPIVIGPVDTYREAGRMLTAVNAEVAWQYSKIYSHANTAGTLTPLKFQKADGSPNAAWFRWRDAAWTNPRFDHRHKDFKAFKSLVRRAFPKHSKVAAWYWDGRVITDPVQARREIYATVYTQAVQKSPAFQRLRDVLKTGDLVIYDIDGYDYVALGLSPDDTIQILEHSWGHGLLLTLLLQGIDPTKLAGTVSGIKAVLGPVKPAPVSTIPPADRITFTKAALPYGWLGNMAGGFPIEYSGKTYGSSEALFQCLRFPDCPEAQAAISARKSPLFAKKVAGPFKDRLKVTLRDQSDLKRMRLCLVLKLRDNRQLIPALLATHPKTIVEDCTSRPNDVEIDNSSVTHPFWGAVLNGDSVTGENALGKLWMEIREELRTNGRALALTPAGSEVVVERDAPMGKAAFAPLLSLADAPLTPAEKRNLDRLESKILAGKKKVEDGFVEMVGAMWAIYQDRLYRENGRTFAEYFRQKWKFERAHSYRLVHCGRLLQSMKREALKGFTKQAHFRPLLSLADDERITSAVARIDAWREKIPNLEITPSLVEAASLLEVPVAFTPSATPAKVSTVDVVSLLQKAKTELAKKPNHGDAIFRDLEREITELARIRTTGIAWTDATWNPLQGCRKISAGCQFCYAATLLATRLKGRYPGIADKRSNAPKGSSPYDFTGEVTLLVDALSEPINRKHPTRYFVNSLSDLFFDAVPDWFIDQVFDVMERASWHTFQVLTKRPDRMANYTEKRYADRKPATNVWLGATVENQIEHDRRIPHLRRVVAATKWLSCEPLLGQVTLDLADISWVIVGGESDSGRKMEKAWATNIRAQCRRAKVPFFFKQWGDFGEDGKPNRKPAKPETLDGKVEHAYPTSVN